MHSQSSALGTRHEEHHTEHFQGLGCCCHHCHCHNVGYIGVAKWRSVTVVAVENNGDCFVGWESVGSTLDILEQPQWAKLFVAGWSGQQVEALHCCVPNSQ